MVISIDEYFVIQVLVRTGLIRQLAGNIEDNITCFRISDGSEYVALKAFVTFFQSDSWSVRDCQSHSA